MFSSLNEELGMIKFQAELTARRKAERERSKTLNFVGYMSRGYEAFIVNKNTFYVDDPYETVASQIIGR
jgi:hypothetical protein